MIILSVYPSFVIPGKVFAVRFLKIDFQIFMVRSLIMLENKTSNIDWIELTVFQFDFCFPRVIKEGYG